ncbi:MAG: CPBP family intramembrane glutamic endopeptidase [Verrucomicrobiota bacterium]
MVLSTPLQRFFVGLCVYFLAIFLISAFLSPPVFTLVDGLFPDRWPFKRVFNRVLMLSALFLLFPLLRYWGVRSWQKVGLRRWDLIPRVVPIWIGVGFLSLGILVVVRMLAGIYVWEYELEWDDLLSFAFSGFMVGVLEEILFRGGFCYAFSNLGKLGRTLVVISCSTFFATAHFLKAQPLPGGIHWGAGWLTWVNMLSRFNEMNTFIAEWVSLFLVSVVLCMLVLRQGHLWGAIALHASWVFFLKLTYKLTATADASQQLWFGAEVLSGLSTCLMLLLLLGIILYARRI